MRRSGLFLQSIMLLVLFLSSCAAPVPLEPETIMVPNKPQQHKEPQKRKKIINQSKQSSQGLKPNIKPQAVLVPSHPSILQSDLPSIQYTIQVGAFSTTHRASAYAGNLLKQGLDAYYFIDDDGLCKVRFDRFDSKERAHKRASELQLLGIIDEFFIVHPVITADPVVPHHSLRKKIVNTAGRFIGTPYRWGGQSIKKGFDCSGLTMTVYRLNGLDLPRNSRAQFRAGKPIARSALQAGDLVFFATDGRKRVSHVGIYCGDGRFIHAPGKGKKIRFSNLSNNYYSRRYMGARRYF